MQEIWWAEKRQIYEKTTALFHKTIDGVGRWVSTANLARMPLDTIKSKRAAIAASFEAMARDWRALRCFEHQLYECLQIRTLGLADKSVKPIIYFNPSLAKPILWLIGSIIRRLST